MNKKKIITSRVFFTRFLFTFWLIFSIINVGYSQEMQGYHLKKICIDPGHGGKDPGALGKKSKEKDICLAIALKLGTYINLYIPDVEVVYTRKTDVFISLKDRTIIANESKADLFISIHINSCANKNVHGASTYIVASGKEDDNLNIALELQENGGSFSVDSIEPLEKIALKQIQIQNYKLSGAFAKYVQQRFADPKVNFGKKTDVKHANFAVLWRAQMPAVLIECGFISNPTEENTLRDKNRQEVYASAIYRAIKDFGFEYDNEFVAYSSDNPPPKNRVNVQHTEVIKPAAGSDESMPQNSQTNKKESDVFYKVQLKSSVTKISLNDKCFKGITGIEETKIDGVFKYTVGKSQNLKEITTLQNQVRQKIPDAFVIAVQGAKRIDMSTAKKLLEK